MQRSTCTQCLQTHHNFIKGRSGAQKLEKWRYSPLYIRIYKSNYRLASLTSVVAKMCKRIVKQRWSEYLEKREILTDRQFRFRKGRSCITNLRCFYSSHRYGTRKRDGQIGFILIRCPTADCCGNEKCLVG